MPAHTDPALAGVYDDRVVHIQSNDRRPAYRSQSQEVRCGLIPLKVIRPNLLPGMEQGHRFSGQRILSADSTTLELVVATSSKAEILKGSLTALDLRMNVVHGHWLTGVRWRAPALARVV